MLCLFLLDNLLFSLFSNFFSFPVFLCFLFSSLLQSFLRELKDLLLLVWLKLLLQILNQFFLFQKFSLSSVLLYPLIHLLSLQSVLFNLLWILPILHGHLLENLTIRVFIPLDLTLLYIFIMLLNSFIYTNFSHFLLQLLLTLFSIQFLLDTKSFWADFNPFFQGLRRDSVPYCNLFDAQILPLFKLFNRFNLLIKWVLDLMNIFCHHWQRFGLEFPLFLFLRSFLLFKSNLLTQFSLFLRFHLLWTLEFEGHLSLLTLWFKPIKPSLSLFFLGLSHIFIHQISGLCWYFLGLKPNL